MCVLLVFTCVLNDFWLQIKLHNIGNVAIDLRDNGGGDPYCATHLLQYISDKPFRYYKKGNTSYYKDLEEKISSLSNVEVFSSEIGELVMEELKKLDKVSFIRFASVYRDFQDVGEFQSQIEDLKE